MVVKYLDWFVTRLLPDCVYFLANCTIAPGVSILSFIACVAILSIIIGSLLFRA